MNRKGFAPIIILLVVAAALLVSGVWYYVAHKKTITQSNQNSQITQAMSTQNSPSITAINSTKQIPWSYVGTYRVILSASSSSSSTSDIYIHVPMQNINNGEIFLLSLTDVYSNHYHPAEYHNGYLYVIIRTGGNFGYQTNPNWTDTLWRYDSQGNGIKLYENRGLDFRVSDDGKFIAIIASGVDLGGDNTSGANIIFLNQSGATLKTYTQSEVGATGLFSPLGAGWNGHVFGFSDEGGPPGLGKGIKEYFNADTLKLSTATLSNLNQTSTLGGGELTSQENAQITQPYAVSVSPGGGNYAVFSSETDLRMAFQQLGNVASFVITNNGIKDDVYILTATSKLKWGDLSQVPLSITLATHSSGTIKVPIHFPNAISAGTQEDINVTARSKSASGIFDSSDLLIGVAGQ